MQKTLSYLVLAISAVVGMVYIYQLNGITSIIKALNEEAKSAEWNGDYEYPGGGIDPEPTDYAEPSE